MTKSSCLTLLYNLHHFKLNFSMNAESQEQPILLLSEHNF